MNELGFSLQETFDWIGRYHDGVATEFLALYNDLPPFPDESDDVNREIREYAYGLGNWVRTNESWSFEVCLSPVLLSGILLMCDGSAAGTLVARGSQSFRMGGDLRSFPRKRLTTPRPSTPLLWAFQVPSGSFVLFLFSSFF